MAQDSYDQDETAVSALNPEQIEALYSLTSDPDAVFWRTESVLRHWQTVKQKSADRVQAWRSSLREDQLHVIGKLDLVLIQALLEESHHADKEFVHDLIRGFPVTGKVGIGGLGVDIPGGLLSRGRPAVHGPMPLESLRRKCKMLNEVTIQRAAARKPRDQQELAIAREVWRKTTKDIELGRAGEPLELHEVNLQEILLVEAFGIQEQHGNSTQASIRGIHNFRANFVNECALLVQKLKYDGFDHMLSALRLAAETQGGSYAAQGIHMGKADFKSAYKTLPADETQHWLCWAVVYNPDLERLQVVPLWSQVFGSLGGVTAWFRTARAIQHIMLVTFGLPIFLYVDDAFWASSGCRVPDGSTQSAWIGKVFQSVVTGLLGWELDADKACVGPALTLLGLDVRVSGFSSH